MNPFLRNLLGLCALALLAPLGAAQRQSVSATMSTGVARLGDRVSITVRAQNLQDVRLVEVPRVEGLEFGAPRGPRRSSQTTMRGSRVFQQSETSWVVPVRPTAEDEFKIPPFVLQSPTGERYETKPLTLRAVRDLRGANLGFLEITPSSTRVVEGQPFTVELVFGWAEVTQTDLADLYLPWWSELAGALELEAPESASERARIRGVTVNGTVSVMCEELPKIDRGGETYRRLRLTRTYLPTRAGNLEFPTSSLEFGRRIESRSMFREARKETNFVQAEPFTMQVIALPTDGQPFDYTGAVGSVSVRAAADTRDVLVGDSIKLVVDWTGAGNLEFFDPPDLALLDAFGDFRVYGTTEEKSFERRRVTYDLAPLSDVVSEIPPVPLRVFDPERGEYLTVESRPIPIRVRPLEKAVDLGQPGVERFSADVRDLDARPLGDAPAPLPAPDDRALWAGLAGVPLLWLVARTLVRRRRGDPDAPLERRRRRAPGRLRRDLARAGSPTDKLHAFALYLAARSREPDEAWVGRDPRREAGEDLEPEAREELARTLRRLEAEAFGAGDPVPEDELLAVAGRARKGGL